jgi:asparagine synthase (glutamine-hydrolysing)
MAIAACVDWSGASRARQGLSLLGVDRPGPATGERERFAALAVTPRAGEGDGVEDREVTAEVGELAIVADARIDNLAELRGILDLEPAEPVAHVLVHAYRKWGDAFADRLLGDFALVLWDHGARKVLAARDPFGVRPLFYRANDHDGRTWFASRTAMLMPTLDSGPALDDEMIVEHLLWQARATDATFFRDLRELPAGHVVAATGAGQRLTRFWRPPPERTDLETRSRDELFEELRGLFRTSVERRVRSRHPVIVHVSGGLDSSSIAMAADELGRNGHAPALVGASATFAGLSCDESPFIASVERAIGFPIERWDGKQSDSIDLLEPSPEGPDARMASTEGTAGDLDIAARHGARTILSGFGGDDLMMATGFTRDLIAQRRWRGAWASLRAEGATTAAALRRLRRIAMQFLPAGARRVRARAVARVPEWLSPRVRGLALDILAAEGPRAPLGTQVRRNAWARINSAHGRRAVGAMQDRSLSRGLEYRYPFYDRELVAFVLSLPAHCLPGPVPYARIHREAFRPMLPPVITDRNSKAEMTPALMNRVTRALPLIEALFYQGTWASAAYVDRDAARRSLRDATADPTKVRGQAWWHIWRIATLEAWMRRFLLYRTPQ